MNKNDIIKAILSNEVKNYKKAFLSFYKIFGMSLKENSQNIQIKELSLKNKLKATFDINFINENNNSIFTIKISIEYNNNSFIKELYFMDNIDCNNDHAFCFKNFKDLKRQVKHSETLNFILRELKR